MNDIDVICRGDAWEMAKSIGENQYLKKYDVTISSIMNNKISFGTQWGIGNPDINLLIDGAETMDGLPFIELKHVINYKLIRANKKDLNHIKLVINAGNKSQA